MLFQVDHFTRYDYSLPVSLGEQVLRFLPREQAQRVQLERIEVDPQPVFREIVRDTWDNRVERLLFAGQTQQLTIRVHLRVETLQPPPPQWSGAPNLPFNYGVEATALAPFLVQLEQPQRLASFIDPLLQQSQHQVPAYLDALNRAIHSFYHRGVRLEGAARDPAETLRRGEGVCRDLALLFMACCRQVGLATRFVSGYQQASGQSEQRDLHAWAEVYLPQLGWLGYDPTHGSMTGSEHLAIAVAPDQQSTLPLSGSYSFVGDKITNTLTTEVHIVTD